MSSGFRDTPAAELPRVTATGTVAVLVASARAADGAPAAALAWDGSTVLRRLIEQFASLGVASAVVITRAEFEAALRPSLEGLPIEVELVASGGAGEDFATIAAVARAASGAIVVAQGEIVTQHEVLAGLLADPRVATGVLASTTDPGSAHPLRSGRVHVASAASPYHRVSRPTGFFLDVVKVAAGGRGQLASVADRLAGLTAGELPDAWRAERERKDAGDDVTALLLAGLVRDGMPLAHSWLRELFWARPLSAAAAEDARARIGSHDEQRALLESAVKPIDGLFTTFLVSPYSKYIARWCARHGFTPNQVTTVSLLIGVLAAAAFATGERWGLIAGAILLQASFTTDCVDGQLARYTRQFSKLGAWLDSIFDRTKEYVVFGGLAIGASAAGDPVWVLACAALTLQTSRHAMDFSYGAVERAETTAAAQMPIEEPDDGAAPVPAGPAPSRARSVLGFWRTLDTLPGLIWVKRAIALPIGERFFVISLTAAIWDARVTFTVLIAWGLFAVAYSLPGRLLRSLSR
jgi:phosphatidylglycerophosphate synthase